MPNNFEIIEQQLKNADFRCLSSMLNAQIAALENKLEKNPFCDKPNLSSDEIKAHQEETRSRLRIMVLCLQNSTRLANIDSLNIFQYKSWRKVIKLIFRLKTDFPFSIIPEIKTQVVTEFWETSDRVAQEKVRKIFAAFQKWEQEPPSKQTFTTSLVKPVHHIQDSQL